MTAQLDLPRQVRVDPIKVKVGGEYRPGITYLRRHPAGDRAASRADFPAPPAVHRSQRRQVVKGRLVKARLESAEPSAGFWCCIVKQIVRHVDTSPPVFAALRARSGK